DVRKSPVATQTWNQRNRSPQPHHSFGRRWLRAFYLRETSDYRRAQPTRPFLASQIDRRKSAAAERYAMFQCVAVADQWLACTQRVGRREKRARQRAQETRQSRKKGRAGRF